MFCIPRVALAVQICQDPTKLERLIKIIDKEQWSLLLADVKGGAGQYFTSCLPMVFIACLTVVV